MSDYADAGRALERGLQAGHTVADALNELLGRLPLERRPHVGGQVLRFVPQSALPADEGYEAFITRKAAVPTREHWHDALNGLVWLHRPALKARLNALHQEGLQAFKPSSVDGRGALRDALTLFDENGAWLEAPAALAEALRAKDWHRLFVELRPLWAEARLHLVGHALLEKLTAPRKAICAHVLLQDPMSLTARDWAGKPFAPLPVLGVPGWWPGNTAPVFYADPAVFRGPRLSTGSQCS